MAVRGDIIAVVGDDWGDSGGDTRWMTYAELAQARGIKEPAAVRLVQRRGWERQPGNDGSTRIAVPLMELRLSKAVAPAVMLVAPDKHDMETLIRERQRADVAEARAAHAEAGQVALQDRLDQVERDRDQARQEREAARVQAAGSDGEVRALRETLAEARRPAWRRWLGLQ